MEIAGTVESDTTDDDQRNKRQPTVHKCTVCNFVTKWKSSMIRHKRIHGNNLFSCNVCENKFQTNSDLQNHKKIKHQEGLLCTHCSKKFLSRQGLHQHLRNVQGKFKFSCNICDKTFDNKNHFESHMNKHRNYRPHKCQKCSCGLQNVVCLKTDP